MPVQELQNDAIVPAGDMILRYLIRMGSRCAYYPPPGVPFSRPYWSFGLEIPYVLLTHPWVVNSIARANRSCDTRPVEEKLTARAEIRHGSHQCKS